MLDNWYPLLINTGPLPDEDINVAGNIVLDWARNRIYSYGRVAPFGSVNYKFWEHNASDGTFVSAHTFPSVCVVSSNAFPSDGDNAARLGTDGFIYMVTSHGNNNADKLANCRLSKISPVTWQEVAAVVPWAVAHNGTYGIVGVGSWALASFKLAGVDYIGLLLNGQQPAAMEIFNSALSSLCHYDFTVPAGTDDVFVLVGEQPTASTQRLYLVEDGPIDTQITYVISTFNNAPSIADGGIVTTLNPADIDPSWGAQDNCELLAPMFCSVDNSIVFFVLAEPLEESKLVKINHLTGAVVWASANVSTTVFSLSLFSIGQAAGLSDLSTGTLVFCNPNHPEYLTVNLTTGAFTRTASSHLDGPILPNQDGVRQAAVWDSVRETLVYYYEGSNDLEAAWPVGGWAVLGTLVGPPLHPRPAGRRPWLAE